MATFPVSRLPGCLPVKVCVQVPECIKDIRHGCELVKLGRTGLQSYGHDVRRPAPITGWHD